MDRFVISKTTRLASGRVLVEVVRDDLQRMSMTVPYGATTNDQLQELFGRASDAIPRPSKPVGRT